MKEIKKEKLIPELRFKEFKEEWKEQRLGELGSFKNGINKDKSAFGYGDPFINLMDVFGKPFINSQQKFSLIKSSQTDKNIYSLRKGDTLFIRSSVKREGVGETSVLLDDLYNTVYSGFLIRFREKTPLDLQYKKYCFSINTLRKQIISLSTTSANTNINQESLSKIKINLPTLPEQQKISSFLSLIDKKIELLNKKKELLEIYKKGIMHSIFNRDIRFKDSNGNDYPEWEEKRLGEIFKERAERGNIDFELLSVTQDRGVVKRTEIDAVDNSNDNKDSYKKVCVGDIAYNSMRMWQGASGLSTYEGIVSPAYTVIYTKENTPFYSYMFKWPRVVYNFRRYSQGLTSDTWNLKYPLFSEVKVYTPKLEEQTRIANFLPRLDKLLFNIVKQIDTVSRFKRGLLQKMFV